MKMSDLKPAGSLAQQYGAKIILYGKPGLGKTPMINTCPRPVLLATEPGLGSMKGSTVPTWEGHTPERIEEFFEWVKSSAEVKNFDTIAIDSGSQLAEIVLAHWQSKSKDGRKAYGEMSKQCMEWFDGLFFMKQKHVVLNCKQMMAEAGKQVVNNGGQISVEMTYQAQPFFPGQDLNIKVPHRYDLILHAGLARVPGVPQEVTAIRTRSTAEILARDRFGRLDELEQPHLGNIIAKTMQ